MQPEQLVVTTFFLLGTLLFCIFGALRLRRDDRQILGSLSLLILVFTWGTCFTVSSAFVVRKSPPNHILYGVLGVFILAGSVAAMVIAIMGLVMWSGRKEGVTRGKRSAIATVLCSGLLVAASVAAAIQQSQSSRSSPAVTPTEANSIKLKDHNFIISPGPKWMPLSKPSKVNPEACLAMRIVRPEAWMIAIVNDAIDFDSALYHEIIRGNFSNLGLTVDGESETFTNTHGITFRRISASGTVRSVNVDYHTWITINEGRAYQFAFWAPAGSKNLKEESRSFLENFRSAGNPLKDTMTEFNSPEWGVATQLGQAGWSDWSANDPQPLHSLKAARNQGRYLQIISVRWMDPPPDSEAATAGLLGLIEIPYPSGVENRKPWKSPDSSVSGTDFRSVVKREGKDIFNLIRVAHHGRQSWLIDGWSESSADEKVLSDAMNAISLSPGKDGIQEQRANTASFALNGAGLFHYSAGRYDKAEFILGQAARRDPNDPVILGNRLDALARLGRHQDILDAIKAAPESVRGNKGVLLARAAALVALEQPLEADPIYRGLLETKSLDDDQALEWIGSLVTSGNEDKALESAKIYAEASPSAKSRKWVAQVHAAKGEYAEALEIMEPLAKENPHQPDLRLSLAELYNQASKPAEAESLARELISDDQDGFRAQAVLGYSYMNRKWYRQAKASFEAALKFAPEDVDAKNALDECSALLGEGRNSEIKNPIEPVAIPPALAGRMDTRKPGEPGESDHARYLRHVTGWHFIPEKSLRKTSHRSIEILDASAIPDFSSLQFSFDPTFERIHANRLEVFDAGGKRVATGDVDDFYVLDSSDTANDTKVMHLPVPGLAVGHRIEVEITREYINPPRTFPFERLQFGARLPVVSEAVFLTGNVSSIRSSLTPGGKVESLAEEGARMWLAQPSPAYFIENGSPDPEDYSSSLSLTGETSSWEDAGREYLKQIDGQLKAAGKEVRELAGKISPEDEPVGKRAAAICAHVQRTLNYHAVEFGVRGRIPRPADDTLRRRQGDCKDHALLLHKMLEAAGIPSSLVLVHSNRKVDPEMPTLDQFNHMIVHVPCLSPCPFFDPTSKASKPGELPPYGMDGSNVLVLNPEKPFLGTLPAAADNSASLKISRSVAVLENGGLTVEEKTLFGGYYAEWMRNYLSGQTKTGQLAAIQKIFSSYGAFRIESMEFPDPADTLEKAEMILHYQVPTGADGQSSPPMVWETDYLALPFINKREAPYQLLLSIAIESETSLSAPGGFSAGYMKSLEQSGDNDFCRWSLRPTPAEERGLNLAYQFKARPKEWPAERYDALREAWRASLDASRRKLEFEAGR